MPKTLGLLATMALLSACAQQPVAPEKTLPEILAAKGYAIGEPLQEIKDYKINGWNSLDSSHLILNSGPSTDYLITLQAPCIGLMSNPEQLSFTTTVGNLTTLDKVVISDMAVPSHCPIKKIETLKRVKNDKK